MASSNVFALWDTIYTRNTPSIGALHSRIEFILIFLNFDTKKKTTKIWHKAWHLLEYHVKWDVSTTMQHCFIGLRFMRADFFLRYRLFECSLNIQALLMSKRDETLSSLIIHCCICQVVGRKARIA